MPRHYKEFPYLKVLKFLLAGHDYRTTAKKFGYYDADASDPTKRFRLFASRGRKYGFLHKGERVRYPSFDRQNKPIFADGELTALIRSWMPKPTPTVKTKEGLAEVRLVYRPLPGKIESDALVLSINKKDETITIQVKTRNTVVSLKELMTVLNDEIDLLYGKGFLERKVGKPSLLSNDRNDDLSWVTQDVPVKKIG